MANDLTYQDYLDRLDIQTLLQDAGYVHYRRDGMRYPSYVRLDSTGRRVRGDKFIVTANGKGCFAPPQQKVYNNISFIKSHPTFFRDYHAGMSLDRLVNAVCCRLLNVPLESRAATIIHPRHDYTFNINDYVITPFDKDDMESQKKFYPWFRPRGISLATQRAFHNFLCLTTKKRDDGKVFTNLSFPLTKPDSSTIIGFEERGKMRSDGTSFKGKAAGSNGSEGLWIANLSGEPLASVGHVKWFESAYDAMAEYQVKHSRAIEEFYDGLPQVYVSTGGTPTESQIRTMLSFLPNAYHHISFDRDAAGKLFREKFIALARELPELVKGIVDNSPDRFYKDWNDELLDKKDAKLVEAYNNSLDKELDDFYEHMHDELHLDEQALQSAREGTIPVLSYALDPSIAVSAGDDSERLRSVEQDMLRDFKVFAKTFYEDVGLEFPLYNDYAQLDAFKDLAVRASEDQSSVYIVKELPLHVPFSGRDDDAPQLLLSWTYKKDDEHRRLIFDSAQALIDGAGGRHYVIARDTFNKALFAKTMRESILTDPNIYLWEKADGANNIIAQNYTRYDSTGFVRSNMRDDANLFCSSRLDEDSLGPQHTSLDAEVRAAVQALASGLAYGITVKESDIDIRHAMYASTERRTAAPEASERCRCLFPLGGDATMCIDFYLQKVSQDQASRPPGSSRWDVYDVRGAIKRGGEEIPFAVSKGNGNNRELFLDKANELIEHFFPSILVGEGRSAVATVQEAPIVSTANQYSFHR